MNYWLIKSEGECYSIDDLKKEKKTPWSDVRNYQARNFMRDGMKTGDKVLFYHSNGNETEPNGIYGIAKVASKPYADATAFDKKDMHYDPKSKKESPTWMLVDIAYVSKFKNPVTLAQIKIDPKLEGMVLRARGSRLSVMSVSEKHFKYICDVLAKQ